jgi:hypothetical protein
MKNKDKNRFYVYLHRREDNNEIFYVGKGCDNRAKSTRGRSKWWTSIYKKYGRLVEYVEVGLSNDDAIDLEKETIKFYRECGYELCNMTSGGEGAPADLINRKNQNTKLYECIDVVTGSIFTATQAELTNKYGLDRTAVCKVLKGKRNFVGNVALLSRYKELEAERTEREISEKVYQICKVDTGEILNVTMRNVENICGLRAMYLSEIQRGVRLHRCRFCLPENLDKVKIKLPTIHKFRELATGRVIERTARQMCEEFGLYDSSLSLLIRGKLMTCQGFCLDSTEEGAIIMSTTRKIYTVMNVHTQEIFEGTTSEIFEQTGLRSHNLSLLYSEKYDVIKGYKLIGSAPIYNKGAAFSQVTELPCSPSESSQSQLQAP